jgi:polyisoprenoid-binding protein YceI
MRRKTFAAAVDAAGVGRRAAILLVALTAAAAGVPSSPSPGVRTLAVDAGTSTIRFHVVHKFHDIAGTSTRVEGKAVMSEDGTVLAMVRVPVATFDSGEANRDANMREVLEASKYPFVVFKGRAQLGRGAQPTTGPATMNGEVELHGVKQPVVVPLSVDPSGDGAVRVRGTFDVSLQAHHVERPSLLFVKIDDRCRIDVDLVLRDGAR